MDWETETDPCVLFRAVGNRGTERKLRLFACAAACRVWHLLVDARTRTAVEVGERYADGRATADELRSTHMGAISVTGEALAELGELMANANPPEPHWSLDSATQEYAAAALVGAWASDIGLIRMKPGSSQWNKHRHFFVERLRDVVCGAVVHKVSPARPSGPPPDAVAREAAEKAEMRAMADIVRCLIPDPSRAIRLDQRWRTDTVISLARSIYEERAFDRLPILADALQDADCDEPVLLAHARTPGPHWAGCWVVDFAARGDVPPGVR